MTLLHHKVHSRIKCAAHNSVRANTHPRRKGGGQNGINTEQLSRLELSCRLLSRQQTLQASTAPSREKPGRARGLWRTKQDELVLGLEVLELKSFQYQGAILLLVLAAPIAA